MRPTKLTIVVLTLVSGLCLRAYAQQVGQRAPQLRSSQTTAQPSAQASTPPGLGDAAWTSSPVHSQRNPQSRGQTPNSYAAATSDTTTGIDQASKVIPAQFTSSENQPSSLAHNPSQPASQSAGQSANTPRALKPPTSAMDTSARSAGTGTFQMLVSVFSSLAIVIGLIVGAGWCYRKAAPKLTGALPKQVVNVLGRTQLAPRQQLVLIRFGSKLILVSNLQGEVRTLSELTDPLEVDQIAGICESAQPGSISESFRSVLHNIGRNGT